MTRGVWDGYWAGDGGGCLPQADRTFGPLLEALWREFARTLAPGARVLDLATGNGIVLRLLAAGAPRLDLTGVDSAATLPPAPTGIKLKAGVAMEKLPFPAARFDAVTSQFGIEYGDSEASAAEAARVLKPGGVFRFVVHRSEGPIVTHNAARREALAWARHDSFILDRARQLARGRLLARLPTPVSFRAAVDEARRRFPQQPAATEFQAAVLQTLDMGARHPPGETLEVLAELERRADGELGRLAALAGAARDADAAMALAQKLRDADLEAADPVPVGAGDAAFAWQLEGARR